ncbi:MAG TPA: hypothetical protein VI895_03085, partial [Bdellovibrionota bacterium]|nr:hypothetical protein [Bdellovibrionota bacterium]
NELCGKEGGGKASLAFKSVAALTQKKIPVALITKGASFFPPALAREGIDLGRILWLRPESEERCRWASEQVVRSGLFPLILNAYFSYYNERETRRLQLAAERSGSTVLFLRHAHRGTGNFAFALRCNVERSRSDRLYLRILKSRRMLPKLEMEVSLDAKTNPGDLFPEITGSRVAS